MISRIPRQNYLDAHSFFLFVHSGRPGCGENYATLLSYLKVSARAKELSLGGGKKWLYSQNGHLNCKNCLSEVTSYIHNQMHFILEERWESNFHFSSLSILTDTQGVHGVHGQVHLPHFHFQRDVTWFDHLWVQLGVLFQGRHKNKQVESLFWKFRFTLSYSTNHTYIYFFYYTYSYLGLITACNLT